MDLVEVKEAFEKQIPVVYGEREFRCIRSIKWTKLLQNRGTIVQADCVEMNKGTIDTCQISLLSKSKSKIKIDPERNDIRVAKFSAIIQEFSRYTNKAKIKPDCTNLLAYLEETGLLDKKATYNFMVAVEIQNEENKYKRYK